MRLEESNMMNKVVIGHFKILFSIVIGPCIIRRKIFKRIDLFNIQLSLRFKKRVQHGSLFLNSIQNHGIINIQQRNITEYKYCLHF